MKKIFFRMALLSFAIVLGGAGCVSIGGKKPAVSAGTAGMFVSSNKGDTWQPISVLPTAAGVKNISGSSVGAIFTDPQDPTALYWATKESGFFYSYDEGRTWQQPAGDLQKGAIYSIAVDPKDKCTIYASSGVKIFKTEDCNRSWKEFDFEARPNVLALSVVIDPVSSSHILIGESNGDILESMDAGSSWQVKYRFNQELGGLFADPLQSNVYYVGLKKKGMYRSKDGGITWESMLEKMKTFVGSNDYKRFQVHPSAPGRLYWVSTYGILYSTDSGDTWTSIPLITGPNVAQIYGFYVNPKNSNEIYYTATINNVSTFYKTDNNGQSWVPKKMPSAQIPTMIYVHPTKEEVVYLGFMLLPKQK